MSYLAQARMTDDNDLIDRVAACAATHGIRDARMWAAQHMWLLSAQPRWASRYAAATTTDPPGDPADRVPYAGADPAVITDDMIAHGVAAILTESET